MAHTQTAAIPPPPRLTGDYATDAKILTEWLHAFYRVGVYETGLLDPTFQVNTGEIDPENLPDPTHTTIARAQLTANQAYETALDAWERANAALARSVILTIEFTLSGTANQAVITFSTALENTDYDVFVQAVTFTGTPEPEAFILAKAEKETGKVTLTFGLAPGSGDSVTFVAKIFSRS